MRDRLSLAARRRLLVTGLVDATLRFYPERGRPKVTMQPKPRPPLFGPFLKHETRHDTRGDYLVVEHVSDPVLISW